jgi:outer membrane protein assembly factor BamB
MLLKNNVTTPVVIDTDGNLRWAGSGVTGATSQTFSGGRFLAGSGSAPTLYRIDVDGTLGSASLSDPGYIDFHHDLVPGKTGLLAEVDTPGGLQHGGSVLAEIDADGNVLRQWDMSAIFRAAMLAGGDDPSGLVRDQADWFHMNSAIYSAADDTLIVSSRENFVVKLDYETGRIRWLLGDTSKYWYVDYPSLRALALRLTSGKPPIGQHALSIAPDGKLMLFNNGTASFNQPPGAPAGSNPGFSAVSKYAIDEQARTAAEVWTYEHHRDIWSDVCSSAYQVSQGGYLIDYASAYGRTRAKLVGLDADGQVGFDYEFPSARCDTIFAATPIDFEALVLD